MSFGKRRRTNRQTYLVAGLCGIQALFIAHSVGAFSSFTRGYGGAQDSNSILYGENSPFDDLRHPAGQEVLPPRTELSLQTPRTPFGLGSKAVANGDFVHIVKSGENLSQIFERFDGDRTEALSAYQVLSKAGRSSLRAGEEVRLKKVDSKIVEFRRSLGEGAELILASDTEGNFSVRTEQLPIHEVERSIQGSISSSFSASAENLNLPYALVDDFVDLFSNRIEFRKDFQRGDTFSITFTERRTSAGELVGSGAIKSASIKLGDKFYAAVGYPKSDGTLHYYDERGQVPGNYFLRYPVQFTRISSVFAGARFHPVLQKTRAHNGVDFAAPTGTPVRTIGDGTVIFSGFKSSTGNMVRIQHSDRYTTEYMHLSSIAAGVKAGSKVGRGTVIGKVGATGLATGPHLHFGLFDKGAYIDPLKSKIQTAPDEGRAPKIVLAMIDELKRLHGTSVVAANQSVTKKG